MELNMKYHNLDTIIKNLDIFKTKFIILRTIKVNQKRGIYHVRDIEDNTSKILKFIIKTNINKENYDIINFFKICPHKNFCKIDKILEAGIFIVLIMDYIDGNLLIEYFESEHTRLEYIKILFELIYALKYLHDNNIVHGDIKPNNIIVNCEGIPIIIDYDLSRFVDGTKHTQNIFGTKFFMPPELVNNNTFSIKSDIWSLGMTMYACMMNKYLPNILSNIPSIDDSILDKNNPYVNYVNISAINLLKNVSKNYKEINSKYGKLFTNTISIMLIEDDSFRPSSTELSIIIQKSKYFTMLYHHDYKKDGCLNYIPENNHVLLVNEETNIENNLTNIKQIY